MDSKKKVIGGQANSNQPLTVTVWKLEFFRYNLPIVATYDSFILFWTEEKPKNN